jgi:type II secretory pathway component PulF
MDIFSTAYTASQLTADVATSVQTTFASLAPVLAVVVGLILTFIVARYVISLFRHAGRA